VAEGTGDSGIETPRETDDKARIFDSSFFALVQETLYLSHFRLIFLSNLCLLYCVLYRTVL